ncbi:polyprenyl synthetase family protein [Kitasatospora indigofera]|uniref:polyprenyl synthetase family protein n=2 Tax=Kitasatospora indigofera TaxID=67307 RepID=UPI0036D1E0CE
MAASLLSPVSSELDVPAIRHGVEACLNDFLDRQRLAAAQQGMPAEVVEVLKDFIGAGGKRLRPVLCVSGWYASGGQGETAPVLQVAASLEMFHAFCLVHDDVMDGSLTRRGRPTVHRTLAHRRTETLGAPAADRLGTGAAILIGDVAMAWSAELLHTAALTPGQLAAVLPLIDTMRTDVMYGQYLDLTATGRPTDNLERALTTIRYKTSKYTVEHPLRIGAALAGADEAQHQALSAYALPLGDSFQLRDDLLGVFGPPSQTGKSCLDDLREGKHTALIALALQRADRAQKELLNTLLGRADLNEEAADLIRRVLVATGAQKAVEELIRTRRREALDVIESGLFSPATASRLRQLADDLTLRTS